MGLFSSKSKTITQVSTSLSRVVQDNLVPNSTRSGVFRSIVQDDNQMIENVLESLIGGVAFKTEAMYRWAKDNYTNGLPTAHFVSNNSGQGIIKSVIESIEGKSVNIEYSKYASLNTLHYGWHTLYNQYGYTHETNEIKTLSGLKGSAVYLVNMVTVIPQSLVSGLTSESITQWGTSPSIGYTPARPYASYFVNKVFGQGNQMAYYFDANATQEKILVTYCWMQGGVYKEGVLELAIPFSQEEQDEMHFQVKYSFTVQGAAIVDRWNQPVLDSQGNPTYQMHTYARYFTYRANSGAWPELDAIYTFEHNDLGSFFPFVHFRANKTDLTKDNTSAEYKSTKKLLKFFGMNITSVSEAIHANPGIADVQQAMMVLGVPATGGDPVEQRYLYDFFRRAYLKTGEISAPLGSNADTATSRLRGFFGFNNQKSTSQTSVVIQDRRFKMILNYQGIRRVTRAGSIGAVDTYSNGQATYSIQHSTTTNSVDFDGNPVSTSTEWTETIPYYYYRKQLNTSVYEEIQVFNLSVTYEVYGSETTTTALIPLDYSLVEEYNPLDRERLYSRSLHFVFNTLVTQTIKTKWYQSGFFKAVLVIIAIVWTIWSMGSDGGSALSVAVAAGAYGAAAMIIIEAIVINLLVGMAISKVVTMVAKTVGGDMARILAVVALVVAVYMGYGAQAGSTEAGIASNLLTASNGLVTASFKEDALDLAQEYESFNFYKETKVKELDTANKLLENRVALDPFIIFGEQPRDYFQRTVHTGNIGTLGFDQMHNYVETSLKLPSLAESLGMDA